MPSRDAHREHHPRLQGVACVALGRLGGLSASRGQTQLGSLAMSALVVAYQANPDSAACEALRRLAAGYAGSPVAARRLEQALLSLFLGGF